MYFIQASIQQSNTMSNVLTLSWKHDCQWRSLHEDLGLHFREGSHLAVYCTLNLPSLLGSTFSSEPYLIHSEYDNLIGFILNMTRMAISQIYPQFLFAQNSTVLYLPPPCTYNSLLAATYLSRTFLLACFVSFFSLFSFRLSSCSFSHFATSLPSYTAQYQTSFTHRRKRTLLHSTSDKSAWLTKPPTVVIPTLFFTDGLLLQWKATLKILENTGSDCR